jgi:hypothetical protein
MQLIRTASEFAHTEFANDLFVTINDTTAPFAERYWRIRELVDRRINADRECEFACLWEDTYETTPPRPEHLAKSVKLVGFDVDRITGARKPIYRVQWHRTWEPESELPVKLVRAYNHRWA